MGIEIADAYVAIKPSAKGIESALRAELNGLDRAASAVGDKAGKSFGKRFEESAGTSLDSLSRTAFKASAVMGVAVYGVANAAGDLEAALSANEQVLGDLSTGVQKWAKGSVENFGLSERAALEAATSFGAIGKVADMNGAPLSKFSTDLVGLAADMAAFANVPVAQTLQDLQGGFAGQTEVLRKYNVYLDDAGLKAAYFQVTGERVTGTLTAQQRIIATNAELWRQTADQQGQAARESDGFARAQDNIKATLENAAASLGTTVLPAVTGLLGALTSGIGLVGDMNTATGGLVGQLLVMSTVGLGAAGAVAGIAGKVSGVIEKFGDMSTKMQKVTAGAGLVAVALVAGLAIYDAMGARQREVTARTKEVAAALPMATKEMWKLAESSGHAGDNIDGVAVAESALGKSLTSTGEDGERLTTALGALSLQTDDTVAILSSIKDDPVKAMTELAMSMGLTKEEATAMAEQVNLSEEKWSSWSSETKNAVEASAVGAEKVRAVGNALEELQDQSENTDFRAIAQGQLAIASSSSEAAESLVQQAEANTDASRSGEDAELVWAEYNRLLGLLPKAQRDVIQGTAELTTGTERLNRVQASTITVTSNVEKGFEAAADEADAFKAAVDRLIGGQLGLQAAQDELRVGSIEIATVIDDLSKKGQLNTAALDENTAAGLANRAMIRDQANAVLSLGSQMLDTGASIGETSEAMLFQREALIQTMQQFGFTRVEAEAYVNQLGLTPENIETSISLAGDEAAKARLQGLLDQMTDIDAGAAAEIQAMIDEGAFAEAERRLQGLQVSREVRYNPIAGTMMASAWGNYFDRPGVTSIAEDGDPEAVLTLGKMGNLRRQLADPRIGGPIMEALSLDDVASAGGGPGVGGASRQPVVFQLQLNGRTVQEFQTVIDHQQRGSE